MEKIKPPSRQYNSIFTSQSHHSMVSLVDNLYLNTINEIKKSGSSILSNSISMSSENNLKSFCRINNTSANNDVSLMDSQVSKEMNNSEEMTILPFNIVVLGSNKSGKTSIINTFTSSEEEFKLTKEIVFKEKNETIVKSNNYKEFYSLSIYDTLSKDINSKQINQPLRLSEGNTEFDGGLIIYDVTNRDSFELAEDYIIKNKEKLSKFKCFILIGHKIDKRSDYRINSIEDSSQLVINKGKTVYDSEVSFLEGLMMADKYNIQFFFETTANLLCTVNDIFDTMLCEILYKTDSNKYHFSHHSLMVINIVKQFPIEIGEKKLFNSNRKTKEREEEKVSHTTKKVNLNKINSEEAVSCSKRTKKCIG